MKTRAISIYARSQEESISISETRGDLHGLKFEISSDTGEIVLSLSEIEELLDAIQTLRPEKEKTTTTTTTNKKEK